MMQIVIYLDDPKGQLMQVDSEDYKHYWRLIGWHILGRAPELKGMPKQKIQGIQAGLI